MAKKQELKLPLKKAIAFHPAMSKALGGVDEAIYIQQLYFWGDKGKRKDGFIYKTKKEIQQETTISRYKQDKIRKKMEDMGVLETKLLKANGSPTIHYKVNTNELQKLIDSRIDDGQRLESSKVNDWKSDTSNDSSINTENTTENTTIIDYFFKKKGWGEQPKPVRRRYNSDKEDLKSMGSLEEIKKAIDIVAEWAESRDLNWSLSTVLKKWGELDKLKPQQKKKKPYFRGDPMKKKGDKWYVMPSDGGDWLEFAGNEEDINWK